MKNKKQAVKHRPKHVKIRLLKNTRGFRHSEHWIKRLKTLNDEYDYPSKYLAER